MRFPLGPGPYRDRLLDAMAWLLVDLHRAGVYWGDCSLANTLFRRDGDKIQAFLVDAETSEIHPALSDGQRAYDLDILVENVAFGLADLGAMQGRAGRLRRCGRRRRDGPRPLPRGLGRAPPRAASCRPATGTRSGPGSGGSTSWASRSTRSRSSRPVDGRDVVRLRVAVANRRFHAHELERLTGLVALEGQARLLLNDLREYQAWLEHTSGAADRDQEAARALAGATSCEPTLAALVPAIGPLRDPLQAYCDVLEQKWLLSEAAGHDVGLEAAIEAYLDARRAGAGGGRDASPTARSRSTSTGRAASTRTMPSDPTRRGTTPRWPRCGAGQGAATSAPRGPSRSSAGARRLGRRPGEVAGVGRVAEREQVLAELVGGVAEQAAGQVVARRRSPEHCRSRAPRPPASCSRPPGPDRTGSIARRRAVADSG